MTNDPTPVAAEARATKATEAHIAAAQSAIWQVDDYAQVSWKALAAAANAVLSLPPPDAKDGAAPSPETGWRLRKGYPVLTRIKTDTGWKITAHCTDKVPEKYPNGWDFIFDVEDDGTYAANHDYDVLAAAPAAPSPDLAALELLAWRLDRVWEEDTLLGYALRFTISDAAALATALRTAILHLKAQPNAGPSADGRSA